MTQTKPLLRTAKEILDPYIKSEQVHSLDPFLVYERFERAATLAILDAQMEAIKVVEELSLQAFETLKNKQQ